MKSGNERQKHGRECKKEKKNDNQWGADLRVSSVTSCIRTNGFHWQKNPSGSIRWMHKTRRFSRWKTIAIIIFTQQTFIPSVRWSMTNSVDTVTTTIHPICIYSNFSKCSSINRSHPHHYLSSPQLKFLSIDYAFHLHSMDFSLANWWNFTIAGAFFFIKRINKTFVCNWAR